MEKKLEIIAQMIIEGYLEGVTDIVKESPEILTQLYNGETLLHLAADNANSEIAEELLKSGCDPNIVNDSGETALHLAVYRGFADTVKVLLKFKADPRVKNCQDKDVFVYAQEYNELGIFELLAKSECVLATDEWSYSQTSNDSFRVSGERASVTPKLVLKDEFVFTVSEESAVEESTFNSIVRVSTGRNLTLRRMKTKKKFNTEEVFDFLYGLKLRKYFKAFVQSGFDDLESLLKQMKTPAKIDHNALEMSGVFNKKDRERILEELENKARDVNFQFRVDGLFEFLEDLGLDKYQVQFMECGLVKPEDIFREFKDRENFEAFLEDDVKVFKLGHKLRIIGAVLLFKGL